MAELEESGDRMEAVGELVRLRTQCVRQLVGSRGVACQPLQLGAVAKRDDVTDRLAAHDDGHSACDQHPGAGQDHLVLAWQPS